MRIYVSFVRIMQTIFPSSNANGWLIVIVKRKLRYLKKNKTNKKTHCLLQVFVLAISSIKENKRIISPKINLINKR